MKKQMTRHEWNEYCKKTEPTPGRCELAECLFEQSKHKLDCIDCEHYVEDEQNE